MNIIKLKDKVRPGDEFFNKFLKGKYAWWIHMRYIVSFDMMGVHGYIACEEDINDLFKRPYGCEYRDTYDESMWPYIDQEVTDAANAYQTFVTRNNFTTDPDITVSDVKKFRTWLAKTILTFDVSSKGVQRNELLTQNQTWVLQYYANNMYDEVVKKLSVFGGQVAVMNINNNPCGCGGASNINSLYNVDTCDPLFIYRKNLYNEMAKMFSDLSFWTKFDSEFILEFKKYIDNILNLNLNLSLSQYTNKFADCTCIASDNSENKQILQKLSMALEYIGAGQINGHKNYINDALSDWAINLYENMEW